MICPAALAIAASAALVLPAAAQADTFCVQHAGCAAGHNFTTISAALAATKANGGPGTLDTIEVGPGTYNEDVVDDVGNPVTLVGSGDSTDIAPSSTANDQNVVAVHDPGTSISSVEITIPPSTGNLGISVDQNIGASGPSFSHIDVVNAVGATGGTGVSLYGSQFSDGSVNLTAGFAIAGVLTDTTVTRSSFTAFNGLELATAHSSRTTVTSSHVTCNGNACFALGDDGALSVLAADDVLKTTSNNGQALFALGEPTTVTLDQSTLIGAGGTSTGVSASSSSVGAVATVNIDGTIIRGFGTDVAATVTAGTASVNIKYSDYDPTKTSVTGVGASISETVPGSDLHNVDPQLNSDFSLKSGSPAIDRGDPAAPPAGEPTTDVAGHPRKVDGDHNGTATIDMGAFEFQPPNHAPIASFSAKTKATTGQKLTFDGSASRDPDHDPITFTWRFGDGATSTAERPTHAYKNAGTFTVTLTVTDDFGAAGTTTRRITVAKPVACVVPRLKGKTLKAAKGALKKAHCGVGTVTHRHVRHGRKGRVLSSKPAAGAHRTRGAKVGLTVSA